ncbi:Uncharacterised protein [Klebsiella pneumoniae]|nr:Uncharacterised protein [Klebsiella pneumoniae]
MSYENESQVTKWLKENTKLSWTRTGSDTPAVKLDRLYTNRSEGYEIRDVILRFFKDNNVGHKDEHYKIIYDGIINYKKGHRVETSDLLEHFKNLLEKITSTKLNIERVYSRSADASFFFYFFR